MSQPPTMAGRVYDGAELARPRPRRRGKILAEIYRRKVARRSHLEFMRYTWRSTFPLIVGRHTEQIAARLDKALEDLEQGISSYLIFVVPFRHGKSDLISRYFPPDALGRNPDLEVILATYGASLSEELSRDAREIVRSEEYQALFPETRLSPHSQSVQTWSIDGRRGKVRAIGIEGSATGKGADILIVDDYLKGRKEAESQVQRDTIWANFTDNLMTRLAPAHIVVILATRWHKDDLIGRIFDRMADPEVEDFPQFEVHHFRARQEDGSYLFPARFSEKWYRRMFSVLGEYGSAALLQGEPHLRGGNMIKIGGIRFVEKMPAGLLWVRYWDLASTEEERTGDDPDRTVGARVAVAEWKGALWLFVDDVRWCRAEAPERDKLIRETALADGRGVWQGIEANGGYKDAASTLHKVLKGLSIVYPITVHQDKVVRAGDVEPIFDAAHAVFRKAWWNGETVAELADFPAGEHDDRVDAITGGFALALKRYQQARRHGGGLGKGAVKKAA
jgi:predicted phage terminase large subunit-like protein